MSALRWRLRAGRWTRRRPPGRGRTATFARPRSRRHWRRRPRWRPRRRLILALLAFLLVCGGGFLWLRTSPLVAVDRVTITGVSGPEAARISQALRRVAVTMTTLDVNLGQLDTAVAPYPVVKRLDVSTQFPHGMRIVVHEALPVAVLSAGGASVAVASDGTLLHNATSLGTLPVITLRALPGGTRITDPAGLQLVELLAAAPWQLRSHVLQAQIAPGRGLVADLRNGPELIFGDGTQLAAKWAAIGAVLASSDSAGAQYVDVTDPRRPAAGADVQTSTSTSTTASALGATATSTTSTGTTTPMTAGTAGG